MIRCDTCNGEEDRKHGEQEEGEVDAHEVHQTAAAPSQLDAWPDGHERCTGKRSERIRPVLSQR